MCQGHHMFGSMCPGCYGRKHYILRWFLGIVILLIAFSFGVKVGEVKSLLGNNSYIPAMMKGYWNNGYQGQYYMMQPYNQGSGYYGPNMMYQQQPTR